jgi:phospholipase/lecithinase/hemolysin
MATPLLWLRDLIGPSDRLRPRRAKRGRKPRDRNRALLELLRLEDRTVLSGGLVGNLVIFGDSFSDVGNAAIASAIASGGTKVVPNPALYYQGRFSNGPLWVDTLAKYLGEPAVQPSLAGGLDYAVGGATVAYQGPKSPPFNTFPIPSLSAQVGEYLADHPQPIAANDLFVVWAGANDFGGRVNPVVSADTLTSSLETLASAGARQFVVPNLPAGGLTPFIRGRGPAAIAAANQWSAAFDARLAADLTAFQSGSGATVVSVDVAGLVQQAVQPGNPFGFVNTTDAVGPMSPGSFLLASVTATDPQDYLWYDGVHPTSKAHQLTGLEAAAGVYDALGVHHLVVTSTADTVDPTASGLSLREMVNLSNAMVGQQTVTFDLGPGPHQITLSGKELPITQDLTIDGPGANWLAVSGNDASRVFDIGPGTTATIDELTITGGLADVNSPGFKGFGGGILDQGNLTLTDDVVSHNQAKGDGIGQITSPSGTTVIGAGGGGGVAVSTSGALNITDSTFIANQAVGGDGSTAPGPGIFFPGIGIGGGVFNAAITSITSIRDSHFIGNLAQGGDACSGTFAGLGQGGAIYNNASLTVTGSSFSFNRAVGGSNDTNGDLFSGDGSGGAIASGTVGAALGGKGNGVLDVSDSVFNYNQALGGDNNNGPTSPTNLTVGPSNGNGGAILVFQGKAAISASAVDFNRAVGGAGAVNQHGGFGIGGGILFFNFGVGGVTGIVADSAIVGNAAIGGQGGPGGQGGDGLGGGLAAGGLGGGALLPETVTVSNTLVALDLAQGGRGGVGGNGGDGLGGGLYNDAGSTLTATDSLIILNLARGGLGRGGGHAGQGIGGGVYNLGRSTRTVPSSSSTSLPPGTTTSSTASAGLPAPGGPAARAAA